MNLVLYRNSVNHDTQVALPYQYITIPADDRPPYLRPQVSGASFGYTVVWIMSQSFLIDVHGEDSRPKKATVNVDGYSSSHALAEAAEVRAQREFIFCPTGRISRRGNGVRNENGSMNLDVQVRTEWAVVVDHHPKTHRKPRGFWDRRPTDITNGGSTDQTQWELSTVIKSGGDTWP